MTNIAIPAAIYESVEKYDQSAEVKFKLLQQEKQKQREVKRKSSALVGPDYMFDISEEECPFFNKNRQAYMIKDIVTSSAAYRISSVSGNSAHKEDYIVQGCQSAWNNLSQESKNYLSYFSLDANPYSSIAQGPINKFPAIRGLIYVYKKIWVGIYFGNLQDGNYKKDRLIDYCLMFKQGTKATNLRNMDLVLEFAESIGYNLTSNKVVFEQVAMKNGDVFIKAQLFLNKGYKSNKATKAINDYFQSLNESSRDCFFSDLSSVYKIQVNGIYLDEFWDALCPFVSRLSMKLKSELRGYYGYFPVWYPWLSANFAFSKTNFYPQGYENYIGNETQPDAKKFIEYVKYSLESSLICMMSYRNNYFSYRDPHSPIIGIYNHCTNAIHSFIQKIDTPRFRSLVHKTLTMVDSLPEEDFVPLALMDNSRNGYIVKYLLDLIEGMFYFHSIWPDAPVDLFYSTLDDSRSYVLPLVKQVLRPRATVGMSSVNDGIDKLGKTLNKDLKPLKRDVWLVSFYGNDFIDSFLKDHISPSTFIEWIKSAVYDCRERHVEQIRLDVDKQIRYMITPKTPWVDHCNMGAIKDVFGTVQQYKCTNPNLRIDCKKSISIDNMEQALIQYGIDNDSYSSKEIVLPMDLFPNAVQIQALGFEFKKEESSVKTWKFLQPRTTKILEVWGRQVRNCVGSSSSYYSSVRAHKAFIILACLDNKPRITIYARLKDKHLTFDQVKDRLNTPLNQNQTEMLKSALAQAINQMAPAEQASA